MPEDNIVLSQPTQEQLERWNLLHERHDKWIEWWRNNINLKPKNKLAQ